MVEALEVMGSMEDTIDKEHMVTPEALPMDITIIQDFKMLFGNFLCLGFTLLSLYWKPELEK